MTEIIYSKIKREDLLINYWRYVRETVERYSEKAFIVTEEGSLSFGEAYRRANVIYSTLKTGELNEQVGVGLFMRDPREIIPAMLGVLKSGNYFIPLDVNFPEATLQYMFESAGIKVILTVDRYREQIRSLAGREIRVIDLDGLDFTAEVPDPEIAYSPDDIVQILFTSGSTGQPKGAIENYRYLTRAVFIKLSSHGYGPDEKILQLSTFTYSSPHTTAFTGLLSGSTLFYYNLKGRGIKDLPGWIHLQGITHYHSTPTVFRSLIGLLDPDEKFMTIHSALLGGEKRLHNDIKAIKRHLPNVDTIRLGYATTETQSVTTSVFPVEYLLKQETLPSGKPREDLRVFIRDENGKDLAAGEEGEIVVYGDALVRGYINNPELTRKRFLADPDNPPWQYFKTGDLGKMMPDGQLVHLGRIDNMVKIKGVRIELDGIESHILSYPGVVQVASKVIEDKKGNKKLATYFVAEKGIQVPISDLRKHLAEKLPSHLLPHYLVPLKEIPLTGNGKVALRELPVPELVRPALSNVYVSPADELEKKLVEIWEEQIGVEGIGVTDDFFDVGGDSLIGVLLFARIEESLGRQLPVSVLLTASTIRKQAEMLRSEEAKQGSIPIIPINTNGEGPALFFIPGKGGYPTRIRHLAKKIDGRTRVYALQDLLDERRGRSFRSVESAAAFYLKEISKVVPKGPEILVGESLGGKVAYEMAQQLLKEGKKVPVLIMLDTYNMKESVIDHYRKHNNIPYYQMLVKKHASILMQSDWKGRLEYLRFYRETAIPKVKHFLGRRVRKTEKREENMLPGNVTEMEKANLKADREYQVRSYPGRVILVKALRGPKADHPSNGWDQIELGELIIRPLDCYHGSILFEPAVSQLAVIVDQYIGLNFHSKADPAFTVAVSNSQTE